MVCEKCGLVAYPNDRFCAGCGTYLGKDKRASVTVKPIPVFTGPATMGPGAPTSHHASTGPALAAAATKTGPVGVKGWLLLLVLNMIIIGPLVSIIQLKMNLNEAEEQIPIILSFDKYKTFKTSIWAVQLIDVALLIYGGIGLASGRDRSIVRRAIAIHWIAGPLTTIMALQLIPVLIFGSVVQTLSSEDFVSILRACLPALIWMLYLIKSKRVRNTYSDA